jgi:hypothetical protein
MWIQIQIDFWCHYKFERQSVGRPRSLKTMLKINKYLIEQYPPSSTYLFECPRVKYPWEFCLQIPENEVPTVPKILQ